MAINKKLLAVVNIFKAIKTLSKKRNIEEIQKKYKADKGRIVRIHITDFGPSFYIQAIGNELKIMHKCKNYHFKLSLASDTLLNIMAKRIKEWDYKENGEVLRPYSMFKAWSYGHIRISGNTSTNSLKLFLDVFDEHVDDINDIIEGRKNIKEVTNE